MKKALLIVIIAAASAAGFLYYDWHQKTFVDEDEKYTYLYSWTDQGGEIHFSDKTPPPDARNIKTVKGLKQSETPVLVEIKDTVSSFFAESSVGFAAMKDSMKSITENVSGSSQNSNSNQFSSMSSPKPQKRPKKRRGKT
jgi:hypothetical protein